MSFTDMLICICSFSNSNDKYILFFIQKELWSKVTSIYAITVECLYYKFFFFNKILLGQTFKILDSFYQICHLQNVLSVSL